ncbi:DUF4132 domain-containing protein [Actinomadura viridis]|uniref:DUF4132 domain-containing protein n=1 Tax=Actinomadura viridis TaxID=58110 RepID=A0A931DFR5_9ACTN|nr:DUF4132 domain-containing protein [Actinomadura viridis]MBG6086055.1 hypothetical protein [Actinomadura viridis]
MSDRLPDEDALVIPESWRAEILPRRGGVAPAGEVVLDPSARERLRQRLDAVRPDIERVLGALTHGASRDVDAELLMAAWAYLQGKPDPKGAAAIAQIEAAVILGGARSLTSRDVWIDAWVVEHGLAFAARASAEVDQVTAMRRTSDRYQLQYGRNRDFYGDRADWALGAPGRRMRALLATACEDDYAEAVESLANHRQNPTQKLVVSYLVPTRHDWVQECLRLHESSSHATRLLWCAVGAADQIANLDLHPPYEPWERDLGFLPGMVATMIEGVGPAIAPILANGLDAESEVKARKPYIDGLAVLPTDEAFGLVVDRFDQADVRSVLATMLERFPRRALRLLAPLAVGDTKRARSVAVLLGEHLRTWPELDTADLPVQVRSAIDATGRARVPEAALSDLPKALASGPAQDPSAWAAPAFLPQLLLRGRDRALPAEATARLLGALSKTGPRRAPAAPFRTALEACDPGSLAEWGWALFDRWRNSTEVEDNGWPLSQLRWTGDAETARRLGAMARAATFYEGYRQALNALAVLASMGSDVALMQLSMVTAKAKAKGVKKRARKLLDQLARERGLTSEQLADRLVPDFGLDGDGGMTLDYGPRRFQVGFDEQLAPQVFDENGKLRKSLPKPGAKDDPELAPAAHRAFTGLKKDVRALAGEQIRRMEGAMVQGRHWDIGEFHQLLVHHPLMWHITRRLVWSHNDDGDGGGATTVFRLAEDRTPAGRDDEALTLSASGTVRIAHPVHLGDDLETWAGTFADYEILQPFPQLGRPTYAFGEDERDARELKRFAGRTIPPGKALGLERQGWVRAAAQDGGMQPGLTFTVPQGPTLTIELSPGIPAWNPGHTETQTLMAVRIKGATFGDLDAVTASELLLTLHAIAEP